jgi:hydrogenase expression/formation protein HypC
VRGDLTHCGVTGSNRGLTDVPRDSGPPRRADGRATRSGRCQRVGRVINVALLEDETLSAGDWVLIHVGFALSKIDEDEARQALQGLQAMGQAYVDELDALARSATSTLGEVAP